jgi:hypothetical protein
MGICCWVGWMGCDPTREGWAVDTCWPWPCAGGVVGGVTVNDTPAGGDPALNEFECLRWARV